MNVLILNDFGFKFSVIAIRKRYRIMGCSTFAKKVNEQECGGLRGERMKAYEDCAFVSQTLV